MDLRAHSALFMVSLFYAVLFSWAGEIMPRYIDPSGFVWLRILTAFVLFMITGLFAQTERIDWKEDWKRILTCAFFGTAGNMFLFFNGLSLTNPINGAVLMMVTPLFVALIDHILNRRAPGLNMILGLTLGTLGAILLMWTKGAGFSSKTIRGDILVAVNAAFYAMYLIKVKPLAKKYSAVTVNRATFGLGIFIIAPFGAYPLFQTDFMAIPTDIWLKIGYVLVFTSFLVYLLNTYGMKRASPELVALYIYLQPVLAAVIAILLGRDHLTVPKVMYAGMILFGVWMINGRFKLRFSPKYRK